MFNRTHLHFGGGSPSTIRHETTVHEHRAPTDDSVKMLREMEEAARAQIIDRITIKDNSFNFAAVVYRMEANQCDLVEYKFSINGQVVKGSYEISDYDLDRTQAASDILQQVFEQAVREVMARAFDQIARPIISRLPR